MANKARQAAIAERRRRAIALRLAGMQWDQIAAELGYSDKAAACKDVTRAMEANTKASNEAGENMRALELARLDRLQGGLWRQAVSGNQGAVDRVLRIMQRRARLLGLDAPTRHDVTAGELTEDIRNLLRSITTDDLADEDLDPDALTDLDTD